MNKLSGAARHLDSGFRRNDGKGRHPGESRDPGLPHYYAPEYERCIAWNDPDIAILWPYNVAPALSAKDQQGKTMAVAEHFA